MGTRRIRIKRWKVDAQGKMENKPITGRHYDWLTMDDLVTGASATNARVAPQASVLTLQSIQQMIAAMEAALSGRKKLTKEEMAKQVELYKNVIETKFGVKLCVKSNINSDMITMELLVPTKLFADDSGRESLADALQNIAMFILNMDNPNDL